jgi:hypothetical protein
MKLSDMIATAMFVSVLMIALPGCERQGPLEEAGEAIDDTIEDAGDAIEDATDGS